MMADFGEKLKALRLAKKVSQKDVSNNVGVSFSAYTKYEKGIRKPSDAVKVKLADYFGVKVQDIFF